ncbi:RGS [Lepeophtheirus salmonis]|uniref:RGS n=1 Tax=Lepeophtheirus salmonis TaxID=72036 RepID=A0A7R8D1B7_LEPSM|nr:RGS [Lepeophtheirus salmonis]CAF2994387.1 RGS [Lepeophtheirus salmonis]
MEATREAMKNPSRFTFETTAGGHVYTFLIKKDCYPRFIRSESYKTLLANAGLELEWGPAQTGRDSATKITLEDFNIHGATGEISDSPEGNEEPRKSSSSLPSATPHVSSTLPNTNTNTNTNTSTSSISNVSNKESSANWGDPAIEEESVSAEPPPPHRSRRDSRTTVIAGEEGTLLLIDGPPHAHASSPLLS